MNTPKSEPRFDTVKELTPEEVIRVRLARLGNTITNLQENIAIMRKNTRRLNGLTDLSEEAYTESMEFIES